MLPRQENTVQHTLSPDSSPGWATMRPALTALTRARREFYQIAMAALSVVINPPHVEVVRTRAVALAVGRTIRQACPCDLDEIDRLAGLIAQVDCIVRRDTAAYGMESCPACGWPLLRHSPSCQINGGLADASQTTDES